MKDEEMEKKIEDLHKKGKFNEFEYNQLKGLCHIADNLDEIRIILRDMKNDLIIRKKEKLD